MTQTKQPPHPATIAQEFMKRTDLKGTEVQAYAETFNWLQDILDGGTMTIPASHWESLNEELASLKTRNVNPPTPELEDVDSGIDETE